MISAVPYVRQELQEQAAQLMHRCVPQVVQAYVTSRLEMVPAMLGLVPLPEAAGGAAGGDMELEDPMSNLELLDVEMKHLPGLARFDFRATAGALTSIFDQLLGQYTVRPTHTADHRMLTPCAPYPRPPAFPSPLSSRGACRLAWRRWRRA